MIPAIWVDTDVALGAARGDVDDGFALAALLAAHRAGQARILGISTVFGNTTAARSAECAREMCRRAGVDLPVLRGAERGGGASDASDAITALDLGTELLCLGPLTNVAAACRANRDLPGRTWLSAVGGNLSSRGFLPPFWPFEFNFARDRAAARFALTQGWKGVTLYPLDVVRRLTAGRVELDRLATTGTMGRYLAGQSERWLLRARRRFLRSRFSVWDLPAALAVGGFLDGLYEDGRLCAATRRLVPGLSPTRCLVSFDPKESWRRFVDLLRRNPPEASPPKGKA